MRNYAYITNTATEGSPEYLWAQKILRYEANRLSAQRKLNLNQFGYSQLSTPIPKYIPKKRKFCLSLSWLLP